MKVLDLIVENNEKANTGVRSADDIVRQFSEPTPFDSRLPVAVSQSQWETAHNPTRITRVFVFSTFEKLKYFISEMITYQKNSRHDAKITLEGLEVLVETYPHDVNDVTSQDLRLAKFADEIYEDTRYFSS